MIMLLMGSHSRVIYSPDTIPYLGERGTGSIGPAEVRDVIQGGWNEYSRRKSVSCEPYRCAEANWSINS